MQSEEDIVVMPDTRTKDGRPVRPIIKPHGAAATARATPRRQHDARRVRFSGSTASKDGGFGERAATSAVKRQQECDAKAR